MITFITIITAATTVAATDLAIIIFVEIISISISQFFIAFTAFTKAIAIVGDKEFIFKGWIFMEDHK